MSKQWIPNFIRRNIEYKAKDILTAQEYNAILNLIIRQGDYNSEWLAYLQDHGIPDAIAELSEETIAEAITTAVQQELDALSASVQNKTGRQLDNPAVTILNIGQAYSGIADFKALLDSKHLHASYAVAVNLIGAGVYPTLAQLTALKNDGNSIVAYGTDGAVITVSNAETVVNTAYTFMNLNGFDKDTFIYPFGNLTAEVTDIVHSKFKYAVNALNEALFNSEDYPENAPYTALCNLPIIKWNDTIDTAVIKDYIDDIVSDNRYMILQVDTDSSAYDAELFEDILDYMRTKSFIEYPVDIATQMLKLQKTIDNELALLDGVYITEENGDKYLNW